MFCSNCGKKNEDGAKFCIGCGAALDTEETTAESAEATNEAANEEAINTQQTTETTAVKESDEPAQDSENADEQTENGEFEAEYEPEKKSGNGKKIVSGIIALVIIIAAVLAVAKFIGGGSSDEIDYGKYPIIYQKDDEILVRPDGKKESYVLADKDDVSEYDMYTYGKVQVAKGGDAIFFADNLSDSSFRLYYRETKQMTPKGKNTDSKGLRIAKDVTSFQVMPEGDGVVYMSDGDLCYSDLKEEKKIANEADSYRISSDSKKIIYESDGTYYLCGLGKNDSPEKIDSDITEWVSEFNEYNDIYYIKEGNLYNKPYGKDKQKVASDVSDAYLIGENVYVITEETKELKYDDLFIDDISDNAENLVNPDDIKKPDYDDYEDYDAYSEAYDKYWDEYQAARDAYSAYEDIEEIKEEFNEDPFEVSSYTLHRVDGKELKKVDEGLQSSFINLSGNYGFYKKSETGEIEKLKLSEVSSVYDARNQLYDMVDKDSSPGTIYIITESGKTIKGFDIDGQATSFMVSENGKYLYCMQSEEYYGYGELVRYNIGSNGLSGEKVLLEDIMDYSCYSDDFIIAQNEDDELIGFINGKEQTITDESASDYEYYDGTLYFIDDYSGGSGDLVKYKNGKKETLAVDVYSFYIYDESKIAYIRDYSSSKNYGDLYTCNKNGGKETLIDTDVSQIIFAY